MRGVLYLPAASTYYRPAERGNATASWLRLRVSIGEREC